MKNLSGKFAIITGAGKGIGAAIARRFLAEEISGIAILEQDPDLAAHTVKQIDPQGARTIVCPCDVSDAAQVEKAVLQTASAFGRIDVLVNNAGITRDRIFHKMDHNDWHRVIDVNLNGVYHLCRYVVPQMRAQNSGSIINLSSTALMGNPGQANYSAAKAALQGFSRTLAKELGPKNVRVNCIAPGFIRTDMMLAVGEEKLQWAIQNAIPMHRLGEPEEIASVAAFLAGEDASWITGQTIFVSGGATVN